MTGEKMALLELIEKRGDTDLVRELLAYAAERLMAVEVEGLCGAGHGERSLARTNQRNGYRERPWDTRAGRIELKIPKLRKGSYFPAILEPCRTAERTLAAVIQEAYVHGVSTRAVDDLFQAIGLAGISKSEVSRICAGLDEQVEAFRSRPLEGRYPYLFVDAKLEKVRQGGRVVRKCVVLAHGVHETGRREILGLDVGEAETEAFWREFLRSLVAPRMAERVPQEVHGAALPGGAEDLGEGGLEAGVGVGDGQLHPE